MPGPPKPAKAGWEALRAVSPSRPGRGLGVGGAGGGLVVPDAAAEQGGPELLGRGGAYGAAALLVESGGGLLQQGLVAGPGELRIHHRGGQLQVAGGGQQHIGETAGVQVPQGIDHRLLEACRLVARGGLGDIVAPVLQVHPVGEEQVGQGGGIVDEGRETDDEQVLGALDGVAQSHGCGEAVHRVGVVHQEHADVAAADAGGEALEIVDGRGVAGGGDAVPRGRRVQQVTPPGAPPGPR